VGRKRAFISRCFLKKKTKGTVWFSQGIQKDEGTGESGYLDAAARELSLAQPLGGASPASAREEYAPAAAGRIKSRGDRAEGVQTEPSVQRRFYYPAGAKKREEGASRFGSPRGRYKRGKVRQIRGA